MNSVEPPHQSAEAETTTARCANTEPAVFEVVSNMVSADVTRLDATLCSFKDCRSAFDFQERFWLGASALNRGSEMPTNEVEDFISEFADAAAYNARLFYLKQVEGFSARCESPIERVMAAALVYLFHHSMADGTNDGGWFSNEDYEWPDPKGFSQSGLTVYSQAVVGLYRVDFLMRIRYDVEVEKMRFIAIECDGHDFHERTKEQAERDRFRDRWMTAQGITVMRFTGSEIWRDPYALASEIYPIFLNQRSELYGYYMDRKQESEQ